MTTQLLPLENVTPMISSVIRILGGNPGKFTLQGTNTYLVSKPVKSEEQSQEHSVDCILVDTGEGKESYIGSLSAVLQGKDKLVGSCKRIITDIVLTHWHHDHIGGLPSVLRLLKQLDQKPPRIHKLINEKIDKNIVDLLQELKDEGLFEKTKQNSFLHPLQDGEIIQTRSNIRSLQVIHTPGHTIDHICLLIKEDGILLTGDHVLGQGTSVFEDLGDYIQSLKKCKDVLQKQDLSVSDSSSIGNLYPAHGPLLKDGINVLQQYVDHRLDRERQILQLLSQPSPSQSSSSPSYGWKILDIVSNLYKDYPESIYPAAARGIFLHLHKLAKHKPESTESPRVFCSQSNQLTNQGSALLETPKVPKDDQSWLQVMDLYWFLEKRSDNLSTL